jgi:hypothetical protein
LSQELKDSLHLTEIQLFDVVRQLTDAIIPVLFWAGYDSVVLVHSAFLENWTVVTSSSPLTRSYPRRWYDIAGLKISDHWQAALRAVMGVIAFRPGITQVRKNILRADALVMVTSTSFGGDCVQFMTGKK